MIRTSRSLSAEFGQRRPATQYWIFPLLVWVVLNGYLEIPLVLSGFEVPGFLVVSIFPFFWGSLRRFLTKTDMQFVWLLGGVALLSVFLVPNYDDLLSRVKGFAQFSFSIAIFVLVVRAHLLLGRDKLSKLYFWISICLFAFTVLERFTAFSEVSNVFRNAVYVGGYIPYDGDERDLNLAGFIRPKVFTSEPSLLGLGFAVFTSCFFMTGAGRSRRVLLALASLAQWQLSGTPVALVGLLVLVITFVGRRTGVLSSIAGLAAVVLVVLGSSALFSDSAVFSSLLDRFDVQRLSVAEAGASRDNESSERLRLVYPYVSAIDAISANPIFGLGVGGKRSLGEYSSFTNDYSIAVGNNAFATVFIYFGLVGGGLFFYIFSSYLRRVKAGVLLVGVSAFVVMHAMGGLETPRLWIYLGCLAGASFYLVRGVNDARS